MYLRKSVWFLILVSLITVSGCSKEEQAVMNEEYIEADLFCDVDFWKPPVWDIEEGTITGDITKKTGLVLNTEVPVQDADKKLSLMLINGELPDIISVTDNTVISQLVSSQKVWELDEFLKKYKPDSHLLKEFPEDIKNELTKRDGAWYALPSHINSKDARDIWKTNVKSYEDMVKYGNNYCIMWNRELLRKAGLSIDELRTEEQVLAAFEQVQNMNLKEGEKEVIPLLVDGEAYQESTLQFLLRTFGAEYIDENGNYKDIMRQEETKDALRFLNKAFRESYASPEQLTMDNAQIKSLMVSGRVLCFIGNSANTGANSREWVSSGPILPANGKSPVLGLNIRASAGWINTFISQNCENPEAIADFVDYMTSEEGLLFWVYGYEGIHYQMDNEGHAVRTEEGEKALSSGEETGMSMWWMFHNTAWNRSIKPAPETGGEEESWNEIQWAYGKDGNTVIFDSSLLAMPLDFFAGDNRMQDIETGIKEWEKSQVPIVILCSTDQEFEKEYETLMNTLLELGILELDQKKNDEYKRNCEEYGNYIEQVN